MKITPITVYKPIKPSFKEYNSNDFYYHDYETENNITIKDAFISAGIVTGLCAIGTTILANEDKIKNIINKGTKLIKNIKIK